jgi:hypothetical protein
VSDGFQLQVTPKERNSALSLSKAGSSLIARGRRDAAMLATPSSSVAIEANAASMSDVICEVCGENKELDAASDGFCCWCRSRETDISEVWDRWGFDRWGRPLDGFWDDEVQSQDAQAKIEIAALLEKHGIKARWIEMWCGFGKAQSGPVRRGQIQAFGVAETVNEKWGFDREGDPYGEDWDSDAQGRAAYALEEIKKTLLDVGLPLPDDWPDEWSPNRANVLNPLEISESVWPVGSHSDQVPACSKCREQKQLVCTGARCASCANALA